MSKHILVTGGAGFIGSHITDLLIEQGNRVTVFDNETTGQRDFVNPRATFVHGDVRDEASLAEVFATGIDAVLHIAGQASIRLSFMHPEADLNVNTLGTINVIKQCIAHKVPRLLFASSMTIYGTPQIAPTPESAYPAPVSYYGVTKYAAERYAHITATRKDLDFELNVTSFRMFNVYGERQSLSNAYQGVFAIFMGNVLRGEPINIHSDGEQSRDFVHVRDVARAWVDAIDNPQSYGEVINIGTGRPISVNRLCDLVLDTFEYSRETYTVKHHTAQPGDIRVSSADITKANTLLKWQPTITFEDGMKETIIWAKEVMQK
ncbi:MAG: SDR family NAD(P)-dependent oxidoreductase [Phototrophicales bacterium]|nr:SDR family NAD(P)-dependent oxidoreductase [Phototrophicales bacterium]